MNSADPLTRLVEAVQDPSCLSEEDLVRQLLPAIQDFSVSQLEEICAAADSIQVTGQYYDLFFPDVRVDAPPPSSLRETVRDLQKLMRAQILEAAVVLVQQHFAQQPAA